jgi:hypothetical protein
MAVPGLGGGLVGRALDDLGLGAMLRDEVMDESEELRKKRMLAQQNRGLLGPAADGALAPQMLFGSVTGGLGGGYS